MIKRLSALLLLVLLAAGCSNAVHTTLSDRFTVAQPRTVAVAPVVWTDGDEDKGVSNAFRTMTAQKLKELNYGVLAAGDVDAAFGKLGAAAALKTPAELASLTGADAVLFIKIREWNISRFVTYASLKVEADYELYSAGGVKLWTANYSISDADLRLDRTSMEYAIIKAYEPKVQRFVDAVFTTLPKAQTRADARTFFQWLP